jgi:hypothetical protein
MSSPTEAALSDAELQRSLAMLVREYARRADENREMPPFPPEHGVTATEAMITVSAILAATNLQLFELGMWQSWAGRT